MKKLLSICILTLALGCFFSCESKPSDSLKEENDSLRRELSHSQDQYEETFKLLNRIQEGFDQIRSSENYLSVQSNDPEITQPAMERIESDVKMVQEMLMKNKEQLSKLRKQLSASQKQSKELMLTIDRMEKSIEEKTIMIIKLQTELAEKNVRIEQLDNAINSLNETVSKIAKENTDKNETIQEQDKALNQGWYVFGTRDELKKMGLLTGGSLFKKDEVMKGEITNESFIGIDIRHLDKIELFSKRAKILTSHPDGSYGFEKTDDGYMILTIKNYEKFWSTSRYLVIQVN